MNRFLSTDSILRAGALASLLTLGACASGPTVSPLVRPAPASQAEVVVYRESSFIAGGVALAVGADGKAFASLSNGDKAVALFGAGEREVFVQARSAEPTVLRIKLEPGRRICLRTSASPSTLAKVAVPITLMITGYHFYLDELPCPDAAALNKYEAVQVSYQ